MNKKIITILGIVVVLISLILLAFSYYVFQLSPTSSDGKMIEIEIPRGSTGSSIAKILKNNNLIRDVNIFRIYLKIHNIDKMSYGVYQLNKTMGVKQIVDIIGYGKAVNSDIRILFKEGINMRTIAKEIANNTNNDEDDVFNLLKDEEYIDSLISKYWFLSDIIKHKDIYYPLEGYLAPNTYQFVSKDVSVKEIFKSMLDQTKKILDKKKNEIESTKFTVHELLTFASIVESEGTNSNDMGNIASVFCKRLDAKWSLQSCVTACYATKTEPCVSDKVDTDFVSPYNTYLASMAGKLPIGPVSNPGVIAIEAAINPTDNDYWFFLSDKNKKTYFSKTLTEQNAKKADLIKKGEWYAN